MRQTEQKENRAVRTPLLRRRSVRIALLLLAILVALTASIPLIVSAGLGRSILVSICTGELAVTTTVDRVAMDWTGGLVLEGLRLDQPEGFGAGAALAVDRVDVDLALGQLIGGRLKTSVLIDGLRVNALRREDGTLNLEMLVKEKKGSVKKGKKSPGKGKGSHRPMLLHIALKNSRVRLADRQQGLAGSLDLEALLANGDYGQPLQTTGKLQASLGAKGAGAGTITWRGTIDLAKDDIRITAKGSGIDLSVWEPLLPLGDELRGLGGVASTRIDLVLEQGDLSGSYDLVVDRPQAGIKALGKLPLRLEKISLSGAGSLPAEGDRPTISSLVLDCGPLQANRLPAARAKELLAGRQGNAFALNLDLAALPRHPGFFPKGADLGGTLTLEAGLPEAIAEGGINFALKSKALRYRNRAIDTGPLTISGTGSLADFSKPLATLAGGIEILVEQLQTDYGRLDEADLSLNLKEGRIDLAIDRAKLLQGEGKGKISLALLDKDRPFSADLDLQGITITPHLAPLLAYVLPFAVTPGDAQLGGRMNLSTGFSGKLADFDPQAVLPSLRGKGTLACTELVFQGHPALQQLLAAFENRGSRKIKGLRTDFDFSDSRLVQKGIKITHQGAPILVKGTTTFAGDLDYTFDFSNLLNKHKDGRKLLSALGASTLPVALGGTITNPKPKLKALDLKSLLDKGADKVRQKAKKELDKAIEKGLKKLFGK